MLTAVELALSEGVATKTHVLNLLHREKGSLAAEVEKLVISLKKIGLGGIEALYPEHPPHATAFYKELADRHHLLITGGTDFHGSLKPDIQLGIGTGDFRVPFALYEQLIDRLAQHSARF